jgi:hypothetical protein
MLSSTMACTPSFNHEGDVDIYVVRADGESIPCLTSNQLQDKFPEWFHDFKQISFKG